MRPLAAAILGGACIGVGWGPVLAQTPMSERDLRDASLRIVLDVLVDSPVELGQCGAFGIADPGIPEGELLLEEALENPLRPIRLAAVEGLRRIGSPAAIPAIERELQARTWRIRREALRDLAKIAGPESVPTLRNFLLSGRQPESVRAAAADALGIVRDRSSVDDLLDLLAHENPTLRRHCLLALGEIADPEAIGPLKEFQEETEDEYENALVNRALALSGDPQATSRMEALLQSPNPRLRGLARNTLLARNRNSALASFRRSLRRGGTPSRVELILTLVSEDDTSSIPDLRILLESELSYDRQVAAAALARFGDRSGYPVLREALRKSTWRYGDVVRSLLAGVEDASIANLLVDVFRSGELPDRVWAATLLIRFRAPFAKRFLERVVRDNHSPYRAAATEALVRAGARAGLEIIAERFKDPCTDGPNPAVASFETAPGPETARYLGEIFPTATGVARVNIALVLLRVLEAEPTPSPL